ncbi:hypothetical protein VOLCADRAFT_121713 [Volvox carteri f. nagariensis]|uniref:Paf1 complex component n=1 Tax=Volvox carteri f. nagariensis TaxID=3068 RepID=D8UIA8_VOLCA|nr:uncharacterized protein VOLCADRAFT_121713 [Volvox carteri f. nagariensis]EFJ40533.1 hypothetical protein VOLCADRAFT_121713 [Volvox carteri f. nagariensis]|eukprot:XP_002958383.1 hypothetical protein VOLCADRAFT_121713 [Volvox carteri f. nagariensis]
MADRIYVPVVDSNEIVAIDLSQVPENAEELLDLLVSEAAPLSTWFDCARAYLQQGRLDGFDLIYETATSEETAVEVERYFGQKPTYERILFFTAKAAVLIAQARDEKTADSKARLLSDARKLITQAGTLDQNEQLVHLSSGLHFLARGDLQNASRDFKRAATCRNNGRANVIGYLAVAGLAYQQQQYKEAMSYYRAALRDFPGSGCPAEVRLGIAACAFKLGDLATARAAYRRGLADCLRHLLTAFQLHPGHACALDKRSPLPRLGMAQTYCAAGQLVNAATELEEALKAAPAFYDALKILGQLLPALNRDGAGAPTRGSSSADGSSRLAATVAMLKDATSKQPNDADMWEMLGELLAPTDPAGALAAYKKALDAHAAVQAGIDKRRAVQAERVAARRAAVEARRRERREQRAARDEERQRRREARQAKQQRKQQQRDGEDVDMDNLFGSDDEEDVGGEEEEEVERAAAEAEEEAEQQELAAQLAEEGEEEEDEPVPDHIIPARLLNNAAVLHYRQVEAGDVSSAMALLRRAQDAMSRGADGCGGVSSHMHLATLTFNRARLMEASGEYKAAAQLYKDVLSEHGTYIDCYLRLACIARAKGSHKEALRYAQSALDVEGGHADALALMSQLHMERRDYEAAGRTLIQLLQDDGSKRDVYGRIGYANTYLYTAPRDRREDSAKKAEARFSKALDEYRSVLEADPRNVWAANGCGAALAELGYLDAAQVYASMALSDGFLTIPDVLINLANVHLARCDYQDAVHLYRTALDKLEHKHHPQVLLYLARALYDSNKLNEAQSCLKRAIHLAPTDYKLRFNYALTMQEWAVRSFRKERPPGDPTKLPDLQRAELLLKEAHRHYEHLKVLGRERSGLDEVKLTAHVSFCAAQLRKTPDLLEAAAKEDYEARLRRHEQIKMREAAEAERQAEELRKQAEEEEARRRRDAMARAAQEKLEMRKAEWRQQAELMADMEGDGAGGREAARKRRRGEGGSGKKRKDKGGRSGGKGGRDDAFGDEEEEAVVGTEPGEEEPDYDEARRAAGLPSDDGDDGDGGGGGRSGSKRRRQRLRAAAAAAADEDAGGADAAAGLEDIEDEPGGEGAAGVGEAEGHEEEEELQDVGEGEVMEIGSERGKRSRRGAAALEEDEDEEGGDGAGGKGSERGADGESNPQNLHRDLFGDEDDDE